MFERPLECGLLVTRRSLWTAEEPSVIWAVGALCLTNLIGVYLNGYCI